MKLPDDVKHNGGDQDIFLRHKANLLRHQHGPLALAKAVYDRAKKAEKKLYAEAKTDGVSIEHLKVHLKKHELERQTQGLGVKHVETQAKYDKWGGLAVGDQGDLFASTPPGAEKDKLVWDQRGYDDIYFGETDPEGHYNEETDSYESGPIFAGKPPSYVPPERHQEWMSGAARADRQIQQEYLDRMASQSQGTPVEDAAQQQAAAENAQAATEAEFPEETVEPEKPMTQREKDIEASKAKAAELSAAGATNTFQ